MRGASSFTPLLPSSFGEADQLAHFQHVRATSAAAIGGLRLLPHAHLGVLREAIGRSAQDLANKRQQRRREDRTERTMTATGKSYGAACAGNGVNAN